MKLRIPFIIFSFLINCQEQLKATINKCKLYNFNLPYKIQFIEDFLENIIKHTLHNFRNSILSQIIS